MNSGNGAIGAVAGMRTIAMLAGACTAASAAPSAPAVQEQTAITIYSSAQPGAISPDLYRPLPGRGAPNAMEVPGYALVRQDRSLRLASGRSTIRFSDVAALIDPTTVTFASLSEPATRVLEQNFQFDLVSTEKLLLRYLDRPITVERPAGAGAPAASLAGTLLSASDGLVLRGDDGTVTALQGWSSVRFPDLPGGLNTKPTLVWDIQSPKAGDQRTRVTYQTGGITWWADYNLVYSEGRDANNGLLDLSAWVSIINQSGASYADAKLKLVAGDVNRVQAREEGMVMAKRNMAVLAAPAAEGFQQKALFEFHLYTLGRPTTLPNNSTKQIELFDQARQIPAHKVLVYDGAATLPLFGNPYTTRDSGVEMNRKVDAWLEFRNERQYGLGIPLPAGRLRVSQLDAADGSLEFIGEDLIDHTPKDETVRVRLGSAFDVVGERRQVEFTIDTKAHWMEEEIELRVRNHKDQPVEVIAKEKLYRWSNWSITSKSQDFRKTDARSIEFPLRVAKDGEAVVRYRVHYSW